MARSAVWAALALVLTAAVVLATEVEVSVSDARLGALHTASFEDLPFVRSSPYLESFFGATRFQEFFRDSFRQKQFRLNTRNESRVQAAFGEGLMPQELVANPRELTKQLFNSFSATTNPNAVSAQSKTGDKLPRPTQDTDVDSVLDNGGSFVFRFEHLETHASLPLVDALQGLLLTTVTPHVYASGMEAQALKPHTDEYDVVVVHMAGRKVWHTCIPRVNASSEVTTDAQRAELNEMVRENVQGCSSFTKADLERMDCTEFVMSPGDVLYMPKGVVHYAETKGSDLAVHMTLGLLQDSHTWQDVLQYACALANLSDCRVLDQTFEAIFKNQDGVAWRDLIPFWRDNSDYGTTGKDVSETFVAASVAHIQQLLDASREKGLLASVRDALAQQPSYASSSQRLADFERLVAFLADSTQIAQVVEAIAAAGDGDENDAEGLDRLKRLRRSTSYYQSCSGCYCSGCDRDSSCDCSCSYYGWGWLWYWSSYSCDGCCDSSSNCDGGCRCYSGYAGNAYSGRCTRCSSGTYASGSSCRSCPSGKYSTGSANSACRTCSAGKYMPYTGRSYCYTCPSGKYQPYSGRTSCYTVPSGYYVSNNRVYRCQPGYYCTRGYRYSCRPGTYQPYSGRTSCYSCPSNSYQPSYGATRCNSCSSGYYSSGSSILACPRGYYCTGCRRYACTAGKYQSQTGKNYCNSCPTGTYSSSGWSSCSSCSPGTYQNQYAQSSCKACSSSQYQNLYRQTSCKSCSTGYYRRTSSSQAYCPAGSRCPGSCSRYTCSPGTYSLAGATSCSSCPSGQYQDQYGQSSCKPCPSNQYTSSTGSTRCTTCTPGKYRSSSSTLATCSSGYYCPHSNCIRYACPAGKYQNQAGQTNCKTCPSSQYQNQLGQTGCRSCSTGYYSPDRTRQVRCPTGSSCNSCSASTCAAGTYQDQAGQTSCKSCPTGKYAPGRGYSTCQPCAAGTYQDQRGQTSCKVCTGGVTSTAGASSCSACSPGVYRTSSTSTATCTRGSYCPGDCTRTSCPPGTYTSGTGQSACTSCPSGKYATGYANTGCTSYSAVCAAGYFQSRAPTSSSDRVCSPCDGVNNYQDLSGQTSCKVLTRCTSTQYQAVAPTAKSNRQCATCLVARDCAANEYLTGTCNGGTSRTSCKVCDGSCATCSGPSSSECLTCPGAYVLNANKQCVNPCPAGTYGTSGNCKNCDSTCATCEAAGSNACTSCTAPRTLNAATRQCISNCPSGQFHHLQRDECVKCDTCDTSEYRSSDCTATSDAVCTALSTCAPGTRISRDATATQNRLCSPCSSGFTSASNSDECAPWTVCSPGEYVTKQETSSTDRTCGTCAAGKYTDGQNAVQCSQCPAGTYQGSKGAAICTECGAGMYSSAGSTSCTAIPAGSYGTGGTSSTRTGISPCPVGYACPGGDYQPQECSSISQYQDQSGRATCKSASDCSLGEYASNDPTTTTDRRCTACPANTFQDDPEHVDEACEPVTVCKPGEFVDTAATKTSDTVCSACPNENSYANADTNKCELLTECAPGTYVAKAATSSSDRTCTTCPTNTFTDKPNLSKCLSVQSCSPGSFVEETPTASSDRECTECEQDDSFSTTTNAATCRNVTTCDSGTYMTVAPTRTSDRACATCAAGSFQNNVDHEEAACSAWRDCGAGSYVSTPGTLTSDRQCSACSSDQYQDQSNQAACKDVPEGYYRVSAKEIAQCDVGYRCTGGQAMRCVTGDTYQDQQGQSVCKNVTHCSYGTYASQLPTEIRDAICTTCPAGFFNDDIDHFDTACSKMRDCVAGQYVLAAGTSSTDRSCEGCDPDDTSSAREAGFSNTTNSASCTPLSLCPAGKAVNSAGSATADRTCTACSPGNSYMATDQHSETECVPVSAPCDVGMYESKNATLTSDRECTACATGTFQDVSDQASCKPWSDCPVGSYIENDGTKTSDRVCQTCDGVTNYGDVKNLQQCKAMSVCPVGTQYIKVEGTPTTDLECATCLHESDCADGEYLAGQCKHLNAPYCADCHPKCETCSGPLDTECKSCPEGTHLEHGQCVTECSYGKYSAGGTCTDCDDSCADCDGLGYRCTDCAAPKVLDVSTQTCKDTCPARFYVNRTSRVCVNCEPCGEDEFTTTQCTHSSNRQCTVMSTCPVGTYISVGGTESNDRECEACSSSTQYQDQVNRNSCKTLRNCDVGHYVTVAGTVSSQRECGVCAPGTYSGSSNSAVCEPCAKGYGQPEHGQSSCTECGVGAFQNQTGQATCMKIPSSYFGVGGGPRTRTDIQYCEPGYGCPGGTTTRIMCDGISTYQDQAGQVSCKTVTLCQAGEFASVQATRTSDRVCSACAPGFYMDRYAHTETKCKPHTVCQPGTFTAAPGTNYTDTICAACDGQTGYSDEAGLGDCKPISSCEPGEYVSRTPSSTRPRQCTDCDTGKYSATVNAADCVAVTDCMPGTRILAEATLARDRVCTNCISGSSYSNTKNAEECTAATLCASGEIQSVAATLTSDRSCSGCPVGSFSGNANNQDTQCQPWKHCAAGTYEHAAGTSSSDRVCSKCPSHQFQDEANQQSCKDCSEGYYAVSAAEQKICPAGSACDSCERSACSLRESFTSEQGTTACVPVIPCTVGQRIVSMPTLTSQAQCTACDDGTYNDDASNFDLTCKPHSVCVPGEYVSEVATATSDRECDACSGGFSAVNNAASCTDFRTCGKGEVEISEPTRTTDRQCSSCELGVTYMDDVDHTRDTCVPVSPPCAPGEYQFSAPTISSDRVCLNCPTGKYTDSSDQSSCAANVVCPIGSVYATAATRTQRGTCRSCDGETHYSDEGNATACKQTTVCPSGSYVVVEATASSDRQCEVCLTADDCATSQFLSGQCRSEAPPTCVACHASCATCDGPAATDCLTCPESTNFDNGECVSSCDDGDYEDTTQQCRSCDASCATCDGPGPNNCLSCPADTHLDLNAKRCVDACTSGFYKDATTKSCVQCTSCGTGAYASAACTATSDASCTPWSTCTAGQYVTGNPDSVQDRTCANCDGTTRYQDQINQASCKVPTSCDPGHSVSADVTTTTDRECQICAAGSYADAANAESCAPCPAGHVQPEQGQSTCRNCGPGTYQAQTGQTSCVTIPAGSYGIGGTVATRTGSAVCAKGFACLGREHAPQACDGVNTYQDEIGQTACKRISTCGQGQYASSAPTTTSDRVCSACPDGEFQSLALHMQASCTAHTVCQPGQFVISDGTAVVDRRCGECNGIDEFSTTTNAASCQAVADCAAGTYVTESPSATENRQCAACPNGKYSESTNQDACIDWQDCAAGNYVQVNGTTTTDRECEPCDYGVDFSTSTNAMACTPVQDCQMGQRETVSPTRVRGRTCEPCSEGTYMDLSDHDRTRCKAVSTCTPGTFVSVDATISSDRVCVACPSAAFSTGENVEACTLWRTCGAGQYEQEDPSPTNDRVCVDCAAGTYMDKSSHSDSTCSAVSSCPAGTFIRQAATLEANVICAACDGVTGYSSEENQAACTPVSDCGPGAYISRTATTTSDVQCRNCTSECLPTQFLTGTCGGDEGTANPTCVDCHPTCATCSGRSKSQCLTCAGNLIYDEGTCMTTCSDPHDYPTGGAGSACAACDDSCGTCVGPSANNCTSCEGNLHLSPDFACVAHCPSGYFDNTDDNRCEVCATCTSGTWASTPCAQDAQTVCSAWSPCAIGEEQSTAPTPTSDRQCAACPEGFYQDEAGQLTCKTVSLCNSPDVEVVAATPSSDRVCDCDYAACVDRINNIFEDHMCRAPAPAEMDYYVNNSLIGCCTGRLEAEQINDISKSDTYAERHDCDGCQRGLCSCVDGYVETNTTFVISQSDIAEADEVATTDSSATVAPATVFGTTCQRCPADTYKPSHTNQCVQQTVCHPGQYEAVAASITSARVCTTCNFDAETDDDANPLTPCVPVIKCTADQWEQFAPTVTSNRVCRADFPVAVNFAADYDTFFGNDNMTTNRTLEFLSAFRGRVARGYMSKYGVRVNQSDIDQFFEPDTSVSRGPVLSTARRAATHAITVTVFSSNGTIQTLIVEMSMNGTLIVDGLEAWPCSAGFDYYVEALSTTPGYPAECTEYSECVINEFEEYAPTTTTDRICAQFKRACDTDEVELAAPTATTDRLCGPPEVDESTGADGGSAGLSAGVVAVIALMVVLLVVVALGFAVWKHRKDTKDKRQREWIEKMSTQMGSSANDTLRDGNTLLRQLSTRNNGILFDNPTFDVGGRQTLRKRPRWYVGAMTRSEAEAKLLEAADPQAGDFVVRESAANGNFVVSILLDRNTFEHHQLTQDAQGRFRLNGNLLSTECTTVDAVVKHLSQEMDGTSALLNVSAADLDYGGNDTGINAGAYGAAAPVVEERDDFYGSVVKGEEEAPVNVRPDWLRGEMSRQDAEMILQSDPTPGNFLIRESKARAGTYAISLVIHDGRVEHHSLVPQNGTYLLNKKPMTRACSTLEDVVDHLTFNEESMTCTLRPKAPRSIVGNPGYEFSEDNVGFPDNGAFNPTMFASGDNDLYDAKPTSRPAYVGPDQGYFVADPTAPALPDKDRGYMDVGTTNVSNDDADA